MVVSPLVVAKHRNPPRSESLRQILERLIRANRLITVLGTGTMHQNYRWKGSLPDR